MSLPLLLVLPSLVLKHACTHCQKAQRLSASLAGALHRCKRKEFQSAAPLGLHMHHNMYFCPQRAHYREVIHGRRCHHQEVRARMHPMIATVLICGAGRLTLLLSALL